MKKEIGNIQVTQLYNTDQLDGVYLYIQAFRSFPNTIVLNGLELGKVINKLKAFFAREIAHWYFTQYTCTGKHMLEITEFAAVFKSELLVYTESGGVRILYGNSMYPKAQELVKMLKVFKRRAKRTPNEISILVQTKHGLDLNTMPVKKTKLDLNLYYEDEFKEKDKIIKTRLNNKSDKGVVLLHGLPGTGKTTYLRYLIGTLKKRMIFIPPGMADVISHPDFIQMLMNNRDSILVIEDAETLITDRALNHHSGVSSLLNVSDGLLSDYLCTQIICTFNKPITMVDDALMRQGRLIARYEFGKLSVEKAQKLSAHLGYKTKITEPMTLAEIACQSEVKQAIPSAPILGFGKGLIARD